jgi:hypothetical protein
LLEVTSAAPGLMEPEDQSENEHGEPGDPEDACAVSVHVS